MSRDLIQLNTRLPEGLKTLIDSEDKTNRQVVIEALEMYFNITAEDSIAVMQREHRQLEAKIQRKREMLASESEEIDALLEKKERYEKVLDDERREVEIRDDILDAVLDELEANGGKYVVYGCEGLDELAKGSRSESEVVQELRERAASQERDIMHTQFMSSLAAKNTKKYKQKPIVDWWAENRGASE